MLLRHIIYLFKLNDIYLETPSYCSPASSDIRRQEQLQFIQNFCLLPRTMRGARLDLKTNFVLGSTRECERLRECCAKLPPKINISHSFDSPKSTEAKNRNMWKRFHLLDAHWIRTIYASSCHHMACRRSGDEKKTYWIFRRENNIPLIIDSSNWFRIDWLDFALGWKRLRIETFALRYEEVFTRRESRSVFGENEIWWTS